MADVKKGEGLVYRNHPLRRVDNLIYYGSMADKYIVMLQILETKKEKDMDVATRVSKRREQQDKSRALSDMAQNGKRAKLDVVIPFHLIHPCKISVLRYWMASAR